MLFEILVLIFTCWNAIDRPMEAHMPITKALHRDGITFFVVSSFDQHLVAAHLMHFLCFVYSLTCIFKQR